MEPPSTEPLALRALLWRMGVGLCTLLVVVLVAGVLLRDPIEQFSSVVVARFGLLGIFAMVTFVDTVPLTHEPVLLIGLAGGLGFWPVWGVASAGSVTAGILGWWLGRWLGRFAWVRHQLARYRIGPFLLRYGGAAVAVAALTPFPYAVATWASGAARLPFAPLLAGALLRMVKVWFYLSVLALGWSSTA